MVVRSNTAPKTVPRFFSFSLRPTLWLRKSFVTTQNNSNLFGSVTLKPTTKLELAKLIMAAEDNALRFPFRKVKGKFLNLEDGKATLNGKDYSLQHADKRYIIHICRQRFGHLGENEARDETMALLRRYQITPRNIKYWLTSRKFMDNIDAMNDVPALIPPFSPGRDGIFDHNVQQHPNFDMNYIVRYFIDHHEVLLLSCGLMEIWYGIPHSTFDWFVQAMKKTISQQPKPPPTPPTKKRQTSNTVDQRPKCATQKKQKRGHAPQKQSSHKLTLEGKK
jgi:hypothetical protein